MGRISTPGVVIRRRPHNLSPALSKSQCVRDIFELAEALGVSGGNIQDLTGYSHVTISRWRNGRTSPSIGDLEILASALGGRIVFEKGTGQ